MNPKLAIHMTVDMIRRVWPDCKVDIHIREDRGSRQIIVEISDKDMAMFNRDRIGQIDRDRERLVDLTRD